MFDWEELSQTVDKSEQGRPDRAGQPLEAAVEGQVSQLLLHSTRGYPAFSVRLRVRVAVGVRGDHASLHNRLTKCSSRTSPSPTFRKPRVLRGSEIRQLRHQLNELKIISLAPL